MRRAALAWLAGPLAGGCLFGGIPNQIDQEDLASTAAPVICDRLRECTRGDYELLFFGMKDCRDEQEVAIDAVAQVAEDFGCDYDDEGASEALHEIADMNCQDFYENEWLASLDLVWPDCIL